MSEFVEQLISESAIDKRVSELAAEIAADYKDKPILIVGILKGGFIFVSDLVRKLSAEANIEGIDFLKASSYGMNAVTSGEVKVELDVSSPVNGKHVLLVEDIVDTGNTLVFLRDYIGLKNPASVKICALLDKPDRRTVENAVFEYLGFSIPDEFVVGYGLDYAQRYRNLPYVGILHFEDEENV